MRVFIEIVVLEEFVAKAVKARGHFEFIFVCIAEERDADVDLDVALEAFRCEVAAAIGELWIGHGMCNPDWIYFSPCDVTSELEMKNKSYSQRGYQLL